MAACLSAAVFSLCVAELLQSRFVESGLVQAGSRGFKPHLTIMKLSRAAKLRNQVGLFMFEKSHKQIV